MNENWLQGVSSSSTIANTRIMGVGISGLLGGPIVGIGVGSIAGIHRYMLGGTTALSCAISSILAGVITGYIGYIFKKYNRTITPKFSAILSVFIFFRNDYDPINCRGWNEHCENNCDTNDPCK